MHKKSSSDKSSVSTSSLTSRKNSCKLSEGSYKSSQSTFSNPSMTARKYNSASRAEKNSTLTSIIEEKVTNLKTKFDELSVLRKKLAESNTPSEVSPILSYTQKPRMKSIKDYQNSPILSGAIFKTEDKRLKAFEVKDPALEIPRFSLNPASEKCLFEKDCFPSNLDKPAKFEIEHLRLKLKNKEKELQEIEKMGLLQESLIFKKEAELKECEEKYKVLIEINKSLKMQVNRLEMKMKSLDDKKLTNVNAIKNLSYIILSKDSPSKESRDSKGDQGFVLKYIETLNQLQSVDNVVLDVFYKLRNSQNREALRLLMGIEKEVVERLEKTKESVEQLESVVYECKSPLIPKSEQDQPVSEEPRGIKTNDFYCFMKCQASLLEELLIVS